MAFINVREVVYEWNKIWLDRNKLVIKFWGLSNYNGVNQRYIVQTFKWLTDRAFIMSHYVAIYDKLSFIGRAVFIIKPERWAPKIALAII